MSEERLNDFPISVEDIMHTAYLQYSLSVNIGRAIPDVRDGMKPCNRRILYAMRQLGLTKSHITVKCAKVVGEVLGNYHPHGDASVYDTLVRMAQDFSMRVPLIEGQGNFGSIDGDPPAAYRYTECRMERISDELLNDIEKETVNMIPTFDEANLEPEVLPAKYPNLLVNGSVGIGVGMATNIPPHNLGETIDATIYLLEHPTATVSELMTCLPGPDFPTGAIICGVTPIRKMYETGHGVLKVRARAKIVEKGQSEQIIVTEIPYGVNKEMMVKRIADLVCEKKITGISGLRDESNKKLGIRVVIDIKRGSMAQVVLNQLYTHTQMETAFGCNLLVVDHNRPRVMNLPQVLQAFLDHRMDVVTRRAQFELKKAEAREHILAGLLKAVQNLDEVVNIIRSSRTRTLAAEALCARFGFTDIQVKAILDMRLHQLTGLAIEDLEKDYAEVLAQIRYLQELLASREKRIALIKSELLYVKERYGDARRTEISPEESDLNYADLIPRHSCVITVSDTGYIKRVPADTYQTHHRNGMGVIGMETKEDDQVAKLFNADSHDIIFFITNHGTMYWLNVYEIPEGARTGKGKAIINLIRIDKDEQIRAMLTVNKAMLADPNLFLVTATKKGVVKKTHLTAFSNLRKVGLRALLIDEDDDLVSASIAERGNAEIILSTAKGMACRFMESDVRSMGRSSRGVTGIRFRVPDDYVVSMEVVPAENPVDLTSVLPEDEIVESENGDNAVESSEEVLAEASVEDTSVAVEEAAEEDVAAEEVADEDDVSENLEDTGKPQLLVVTSKGMGKRSYVEKYRLTKRGAKGVLNLRMEEGETVVAAISVQHGDELMIMTERGQIARIPVDEIRIVGRASKGVRIMNLSGKNKKQDRIISVSRIVQVETESPQAETDNGFADAPVSADIQQAGEEYYDVSETTDTPVE